MISESRLTSISKVKLSEESLGEVSATPRKAQEQLFSLNNGPLPQNWGISLIQQAKTSDLHPVTRLQVEIKRSATWYSLK